MHRQRHPGRVREVPRQDQQADWRPSSAAYRRWSSSRMARSRPHQLPSAPLVVTPRHHLIAWQRSLRTARPKPLATVASRLVSRRRPVHPSDPHHRHADAGPRSTTLLPVSRRRRLGSTKHAVPASPSPVSQQDDWFAAERSGFQGSRANGARPYPLLASFSRTQQQARCPARDGEIPRAGHRSSLSRPPSGWPAAPAPR